jgi:molecular chaperone GrpE
MIEEQKSTTEELDREFTESETTELPNTIDEEVEATSDSKTIAADNDMPVEPSVVVEEPTTQDAKDSSLNREIDYLKEQLEQQIQQTEGFKSQYMRIAADFDNFRRRSLKEKEELEPKIKKTTLAELLSVVDNFERARNQIKPNTDAEKAIHNSYQGVYKTLVDSLKRLGVSAMRPEGQPFDPQYHEAMLREETDEHPEGIVIEQLMRGYLLGEQVLRHAMVKVAVPKELVITSEEEKPKEEIDNPSIDVNDN